jgi:hypothetical protein
MSFATNSVGDALAQLSQAVESRCQAEDLSADVHVVRTPVALVFVRGDRAEPGASLARQIVASFGYWNLESAKYLDLVFFGWWKDGETVGFQGHDNARIFIECYEEVQRLSKWRYSGETDILLVDFEMPVMAGGKLEHGVFSFRNCIYLPIEEMIADKRIRSLDALVHELVAEARVVFDRDPLQGTAFDVSDRIAWTRGRRALWDRLKTLFLRDWSKVYDELRPFSVCNLSV